LKLKALGKKSILSSFILQTDTIRKNYGSSIKRQKMHFNFGDWGLGIGDWEI
jgi:hypothetical protein